MPAPTTMSTVSTLWPRDTRLSFLHVIGGMPRSRLTIEATASYVLSASRLRKVPRNVRGVFESSVSFKDGFRIAFDLAAAPGELIFTFRHPIRSWDERETSYLVRAVAAPVRFGGHRWWWICPRTGRRVFKLFLPCGGWQFWSRQAYGLGYACQRETRTDRLMRRARKLQRALGGNGQAIGQAPPPKPKLMRWRTYERKVAEWQAADDAADNAFAADAIRRFGLRL